MVLYESKGGIPMELLLIYLIVIALIALQILIIAILFHFACPKCPEERTEKRQQSVHHRNEMFWLN